MWLTDTEIQALTVAVAWHASEYKILNCKTFSAFRLMIAFFPAFKVLSQFCDIHIKTDFKITMLMKESIVFISDDKEH